MKETLEKHSSTQNTVISTTVNNPVIFCNFGHEDMTHVTRDSVLRQIVDNTGPRTALQGILNLIYFKEGSHNSNETFLIADDGQAYERASIIVGGRPVTIHKPVVDSNALVETVCYKGVNIMDDAFNKNDVYNGKYYMRGSLEKNLGDERVDEYDDFISDATNSMYSKVAKEDPELCALKDALLAETRDNINVKQVHMIVA